MKNKVTTKLLTVETSFNTFRQKSHFINIAIGQEDGSEEVARVEIKPGKFNYDDIVDILVSSRYPASKMDAIQNNYFALSLRDPEPGDEAIKDEMIQMQEWRTSAKEIARQVLNK